MTVQRRLLIVNNAEADNREFVLPIQEILDALSMPYGVIEYEQLSEHEVNGYSGVILSASPKGNDIVEHHQQHYQWVRGYPKPVLGICAGHQIIGVLFGGKLLRNMKSEIGAVVIQIVRDDEIFNGMERKFSVVQEHMDSVTCPQDFAVLASSDRCKNQVMKHRKRPIYSTQFHAEKSETRVITNFVEIVRHLRIMH